MPVPRGSRTCAVPSKQQRQVFPIESSKLDGLIPTSASGELAQAPDEPIRFEMQFLARGSCAWGLVEIMGH